MKNHIAFFWAAVFGLFLLGHGFAAYITDTVQATSASGTSTNSGSLVVNGTLTATNAAISRPHIALSCTGNLSNAGATLSNVVYWTNIDDSYLMTTNGPAAVIQQAGTYLAIISQILRTGTAEGGRALVWLRQNGTNMVRSGTLVEWPVVTGGSVLTNMTQVIAAPIMFEATANDQIELLWWSDNTTVTSPSTPEATNPPRPASPAVILTIEKSSR